MNLIQKSLTGVFIGLLLTTANAVQYYNCTSDAGLFKVTKQPNGAGQNWCVWTITTGVSSHYQSSQANFDPLTFQLKKPPTSPADCVPVSYTATTMQYDGSSMSCWFTPKKAKGRPQTPSYGLLNGQLQYFKNGQWTNYSGGQCPAKDTSLCRVAVGN